MDSKTLLMLIAAFLAGAAFGIAVTNLIYTLVTSDLPKHKRKNRHDKASKSDGDGDDGEDF